MVETELFWKISDISFKHMEGVLAAKMRCKNYTSELHIPILYLLRQLLRWIKTER